MTVAYAKKVISQLNSTEFINSQISGYSFVVKKSNYGGLEQRWLVVESEARKEADLRQLEKRVVKLEATAQKKLQKLRSEEFACHQDAIKAAAQLSKQLKYHHLTNVSISKKPAKKFNKSLEREQLAQECYQFNATLEKVESVIEAQKRCAGRFVLATNVLAPAILSHDEMIAEYKAQQSCERGFGFLKDPLFFSDSVFLKSPERIEALAMVMGLCLLVYTLAQRQLRAALSAAKTNRPTLRWIFQCFQAVHLVIINEFKQISDET